MTECHYCLYQKETAINMQNLASSQVSGGPYCNSNVTAELKLMQLT